VAPVASATTRSWSRTTSRPGPPAAELTSAELTPEEKNAISHRGEAFRALAPLIAEVLRG